MSEVPDLGDIEIHRGSLTGIEAQTKFDLSKLRGRLKAAEDGIDALEPQP